MTPARTAPAPDAGHPPAAEARRITKRDGAAIVLVLASLAIASYAVFGVDPTPPAVRATDPGVPAVSATPVDGPQPDTGQTAGPFAAPTMGVLSAPRPYHLPPPADREADGTFPDATALYEHVVDRIARITRLHGDRESIASGFLLDDGGHILTSAARAPTDGTFVSLLGLGTRPARVMRDDAEQGFALLRIDGMDTRAPLRLADHDPQTEAPAFAIGAHDRAGFALKPLRASAPEDVHPAGGGAIRFDGAVPGGMAGAPVCDERGRVIGIVSATPPDDPGGVDVLPVQAAVAWLIAPAPDTPAYNLTAADYVRFGVRQQDPGVAVRAFRTALSLQPGMPVATYNLGLAARAHSGSAATAVAAFRQATRLDPTLSDAYVNWALLSVETGDLAGAATLLENATALDGADADAWCMLGEVYRRLGRPEAAEQTIRRALVADSAWANAQYNLGVLYAGPLSDSTKARTAFARYAQLAPDSPDAAALAAFAARPLTPGPE